MSLSMNRNTIERDGKEFGFTVANGQVVYQGALVALNSLGQAIPAATSSLSPVGVAMHETLGGDMVVVRRGVFAFNNSLGNEALSKADVNKPCYIADDCTVKKTAGSPIAPLAGVVMDVDAIGVWVRI